MTKELTYKISFLNKCFMIILGVIAGV
jgi:hypothetical protein